jgi:hypothetical protein
MTIQRCTVEHPFGTIKRMSGGGRFLTRGLRAVKAEAALSILAFNILHAVNAFGVRAITPSSGAASLRVGRARPSLIAAG